MRPGGFDKTGFDRPMGDFIVCQGISYLRRIIEYGIASSGLRRNPFGLLNYKYPIVWVQVMPGHTIQETGVWVPATTTEKSIVGRIEDEVTGKINAVSVLEERQKPSGQQTLGGRVIRTQEHLGIGDHLRITEKDGQVSVWEVDSIVRAYRVYKKYMNVNWTAYTLTLVDPSKP